MSFTNYDEIRDVLGEVQFNDWEFHVLPFTQQGGPIMGQLGPNYLQIQFMAPDLTSGKPERQYCRKWSLSLHMTVSEVVYTAFKAVMAALEHEAREQFRFRGASCLGPHVDVEQMVALTRKASAHDHRTGQWVKPPEGALV
jgi:hypothetical protein